MMKKAYQAYKDSGISWIGQIPQHWEVRKSTQVFQKIGSGTTPSTSIQGYYSDEDGVHWLQTGDLNDGLIECTAKKITLKALHECNLKVYPVGSVVIAMYGATIGKVGLLNIETATNQACCVLSPSSNCLSKYALYVFNVAKLELVRLSVGGGQPNISQEIIKHTRIPLPPLTEQEAIVSYLEEKTAKIDRFVTKKEEQILRLKELREAIIAQAVTRGIQPDVALRPSGVSWLSDIPEHWEVKRLGLSFKENKNLNSSLECSEAYKFNYGTLVQKDEGVNFEELAETYVKYTLLQENDIVINGLNLNYDFVTQRVALATQMGIITSSYLVLSPREGVNHHYYSLLFKAMDSMKLFHGMGSGIRLTLSYKDLKNQALPLPPLSEQKAIVAHITEKTEKIDQLIESYRQEIDRIKELKQGLISDAVLGRINVQTE